MQSYAREPTPARHRPRIRRVEDVEVLFEGDTVRLVFGGPLMTVLAVKADRCCCFWFDEEGQIAHGEFERDVVRFVEPAVRLIPHSEPFWRKRLPTPTAARSMPDVQREQQPRHHVVRGDGGHEIQLLPRG